MTEFYRCCGRRLNRKTAVVTRVGVYCRHHADPAHEREHGGTEIATNTEENPMTTASRFTITSSMTTTTIGEHVLSVPGRHEARALSDMCPECGELRVPPATVLDVCRRGRTSERLASYRCRACGVAWLCSWWPPGRPELERVPTPTGSRRTHAGPVKPRRTP